MIKLHAAPLGMKTPSCTWDPALRSVRLVLAAVCLVCLGWARKAKADVDPADAVSQVESSVADATGLMSDAARRAHTDEINQALANLKDLASGLADGPVKRSAADAEVADRKARAEVAQADLNALQAQMDAESAPIQQEGRARKALEDDFNAKFAGKTFKVPEPYNSLKAEQSRIQGLINETNGKIEAFNRKYEEIGKNQNAVIAARLQELKDAVKARDDLNRALLAKTQQFQDAIDGLTKKLIAWVKETPIPPPGSDFHFKSDNAIDQLMRAYNQRAAMESDMPDLVYTPVLTRGAEAKSQSMVAFDSYGGKGGALVVVTDKGSVPAPAEMQKSSAIRELLDNQSTARNAVNDAQKHWDEVVHNRASTPQQIQEADRHLTAVTANMVQIRYQQKVATGLLGRTASGP